MRTNLCKKKDHNNFELEHMDANSSENAQFFSCLHENQIKWESNSPFKYGFECIRHCKIFILIVLYV